MLGLSEISDPFRGKVMQHGTHDRFFLLRANIVATFPKIPNSATRNTPIPAKINNFSYAKKDIKMKITNYCSQRGWNILENSSYLLSRIAMI